MLGVFLCGSVGTMVGAVLGWFALHNYIPELDALAGVFTGTYIGMFAENTEAVFDSFHTTQPVR